MVFTSIDFWIFYIIVYFLYWLIPNRFNRVRLCLLLLASLYFYTSFNFLFIVCLVIVLFSTYTGAILLRKFETKKRLLFIVSLIISLTPLLFYKYFNFFSDNISALLGLFSYDTLPIHLKLLVPIGISFYTFQAVGYLIDVYRNKIQPEKSLIVYSLFISYFPQILSGPISRADKLIPVLKKLPKFSYDVAVRGFRMVLWGLFLKLIIADRCGIYVDAVFSGFEKYSSLGCFLTSIIYSIQIYADFAGYSLIAIGVSYLMCIPIIQNFNRPYFSVSVTDFWRRWHISLSSWLKDYVYISLGGNRVSRIRNYFNILITFLVSGIWHGANWTFIVWGFLHGFFQIIEKATNQQKNKYGAFGTVTKIAITFLIVNFCWVVFRSPSIEFSYNYLKHIIVYEGGELFASIPTLLYIVIGFVILFSYEIIREFRFDLYKRLYNNVYCRWFVYIFLIAIICLFGVFDNSSFIYVSF